MSADLNKKTISFNFKIEDLYQSQNFYINYLFDLYGSDKGTLNDNLKKPYPWNSHTYGSYSTLKYKFNAVSTMIKKF